MAADDKTEKPTAKRKKEARKKGQVAKSTDLNTALVLVGGLVAISMIGGTIVSGVAASMRATFAQISTPNAVTSGAGLNGLFHAALHTLLTTVAPIGGICMGVGVLANVAQVGFRPSASALKPDFKRINPATGFKNTFGPRIAFETAKALAKVAVVGAVVAMALIPDLTNLGASVGTPPGALGHLIASGAMGIAIRAVAAFLLIGLIDYAWQKRRHLKQLKMTKQEVKEESKAFTSPPEVRAAMRRRQMQNARARMMAAVPQADVVVTNPTHYAVALAYDGSKPAPIVVAKGKDLVAAQIRRIATENNVPIVPDPPLARSLHASVELGQMIPAELFAAVAQVLAFVYRMAGRRRASAT
jgi:flagellar biosynthetic protein FlhB